MAPFLPISPCCVQGSILPGTPRGTFEPAGGARSLGRYVVRPEGGSKSPKAALVLFYDIFGFQIPNPKLLADAFCTALGVDVIVPDYMPAGLPADHLAAALEAYPGEKAAQGWLARAWGKLSLLRVLPYAGGMRDGAVNPKGEVAVAELKAEGYTRLVGIGYCRGGSVLTHLLSSGAALDAAVVVHPGVEAERWGKIVKPTLWLLSDPAHEHFFKPAQVAQLEATFARTHAPFELKVYDDTVHGFGARPALEHAATRAAFEDANARAVAFARRHLGLE
ncbi:hypothetical protein Q8F55_005034 [Vanrija albida]|uniref:Dienelactone hydrolase domain-containing protein n=1 Tax=Vanrija albida TaxID=181172 RepID=A0ABR3Q1G2_9TREE